MSRATMLLLAGTVLLVGCIGVEDPETVQPDQADSEAEEVTWFEKVHHPSEIQDKLSSYQELPGVTVETIGTSFEDRPIQLATIGEGSFDVWMTGRFHGDEPTGGEAILLAIETLADPNATLPKDAPPIVASMHERREEILDRLTFHFVPVVNPDGAAAYQRGTALGVDANRDNFLFTQDATRALREAFWERTPDACLDLHNMGQGSTDYDAYGPVGPLMEEEPNQRMLENADKTVREVDAAGGNAGHFNENYRAPPPADDHPNPTAYHPGTHDLFCTARGAPGWTPEGAIPGGDNGIDTHPFEWSTRLHLVTIAASALDWSGAYEATQPRLTGITGTADPLVEHEVDVQDQGPATFQAVWRQTDTASDHNPTPTRFTVTTPDGTMHEGREPVPEAWTSTVTLDDAEPGTYTLTLTGLASGWYELRTYTQLEPEPLVDAQRDEEGVSVRALDSAPGPVDVVLTDVADETSAVHASNAMVETVMLEGLTGNRTLAIVDTTLEPGEEVTIASPDAWQNEGPYRFTASNGDLLHAGIEDARNPS